jgi:hypothetical protein
MSQGLPSFPDDTVQYVCSEWWRHAPEQTLCRGRLIRAFVPHIDQEPYVLITEGRAEGIAHERATFRMEPFIFKEVHRAPALPVAALPQPKGERRFVYRGKIRPALVLACEADDIEKSLVSGAARWLTAKTFIVAPYYGTDQDGTRGGWPPAFVQRIRHAMYPQYMCDRLPIGGVNESVLRFDQVQPIGKNLAAIEILPFRLCEEALDIIDDWIVWYYRRAMPADGTLFNARAILLGE